MDLDKITKNILAIIATVGFFGLIFSLLFFSSAIAPEAKEFVGMLIITVTILAKEIYGFYFGSSQGAEDMTKNNGKEE